LTIEERINSVISEIKSTSEKMTVAFSGGKDSTLVAVLASMKNRKKYGKLALPVIGVLNLPSSTRY